MHSGNGPHEEMDRWAIACFDQAMHDAGLEETGPLRQVLHDYFAWATATTMSRYHESADEVPGGMSIPRCPGTACSAEPAQAAPGRPGRVPVKSWAARAAAHGAHNGTLTSPSHSELY